MIITKRSGFIKLVLLIIAAILILSYFGVSLRNIANSDTGKDNFGFIKDTAISAWHFCVNLWNDTLRDKAISVWDNYILKFTSYLASRGIDMMPK